MSFTLDSTAPASTGGDGSATAVTVSGTSYTIKGTADANSLVRVWSDSNANSQKDVGEPLAGSQQLNGGATSSASR